MSEVDENSHEKRNIYAELYRRVEATGKSRYNASRRFQWQHTLSQWTIAFLSLALIIVPLLQLSDIDLSFNDKYINAMQIIFAALVLVYSLLIGSENFSRRSEKLHRCGLELGRLTRELKPYKERQEESEAYYDHLQNKYYDTLEKYENHSHVDFLFTKLDLHEQYFRTWPSHISAFIIAWTRYLIAFSGHAIVNVFVFLWVAFMILY